VIKQRSQDGLSPCETHRHRRTDGYRWACEPIQNQKIAAVDFDGERAIAQADASGPIPADFLELQGRMARIGFEKSKIGVGQFSDRKRQRLIGSPEFR
jgi:hypothetical protein